MTAHSATAGGCEKWAAGPNKIPFLCSFGGNITVPLPWLWLKIVAAGGTRAAWRGTHKIPPYATPATIIRVSLSPERFCTMRVLNLVDRAAAGTHKIPLRWFSAQTAGLCSTMSDDSQRNGGKSIVCKDLDDCDRTDGHSTGHYSWREVAAACHGDGGTGHE